MQEFGLELLVRQDNIQRSEEQLRQDRHALIATGQYEVTKVFPEWFSDDATADASEEVGVDEGEFDPSAEDVAYDFSGVRYISPSELDAAEREALMREIDEDSYVEVGN